MPLYWHHIPGRRALRLIGSRDPDHDVHVLGNYITGLMLHQLAIPDPGFDPAD